MSSPFRVFLDKYYAPNQHALSVPSRTQGVAGPGPGAGLHRTLTPAGHVKRESTEFSAKQTQWPADRAVSAWQPSASILSCGRGVP